MRWPSDSDVFALAAPLIKAEEGYSATPYLCPRPGGGVWTIGWGTTRYPGGTRVSASDAAIDHQFAERCLIASMRRVWQDLKPLLARAPALQQAAALLSLAYNVGVGAQDGIKGDLANSTLLAKFNAGDLRGAADEFSKWKFSNGRVLPGLVKRRARERALFLVLAPERSGGGP